MIKFNKKILAFVIALQIFTAAIPTYATDAENITEDAEEFYISGDSTVETEAPSTVTESESEPPEPEPVETVPEVTENVPETTENVPETTENVPETTENVPEATEPVPPKYTYSIPGLGNITDAYTKQLGTSTKYYRYSYNDGDKNQVAFVLLADASRGAFLNGAKLGNAFGDRGKVSSLEINYNSNQRLIAGVNSDFFSTKTGVPMGVYIENGRFVSSSDNRYSIGIDAEGKVFMGKVDDSISLIHNEKTVNLSYLNKYPTVYGAYLLTRDFGATTRLAENVPSTEYIISLDSDIYLGTHVYGEVIEIRSGISNGEIPENCAVLVVPDACPQREELSALAVGDSVHLVATANEQFTHAWNAIGGGDVILIDGEPTDWLSDESIETTRNPRTAVGITADASFVVIVIDGRQAGYSSGVKMTALAETMKSLGCIYAINLDGGGSSVMVHFTDDGSKIVNSPSDGSERRVPNAVLLYENTDVSADFHTLSLTAEHSLVLSGSTLPLEAILYDVNGATNIKVDEFNTTFEVDELFGKVEFIDEVPHFIAADADGIGKITASIDLGDEVIDTDLFLRVTSKIDSLTFDRAFVVTETDTHEVLTVGAKYNGEDVYFDDLLVINFENDSFDAVLNGKEVHILRKGEELSPAFIKIEVELCGLSASSSLYFDSDLKQRFETISLKNIAGISNDLIYLRFMSLETSDESND